MGIVLVVTAVTGREDRMVRGELTGPPKVGIGKSEPFKAFLTKSKGGRQHLPVKPRK